MKSKSQLQIGTNSCNNYSIRNAVMPPGEWSSSSLSFLACNSKIA